MKKKAYYWVGVVGVVGVMVISVGCSRKQEAEPSKKEPVSAAPVYPMKPPPEDPEETIPYERLNIQNNSRVVLADFNMDKLEDIALIEETPRGKSSLAVYLRKKTDGLRKLYYKAVGIEQEGDYTISALMSKRTEKGTDLLVIINYPDGRKEMVYYRSDGKAFHEIDREELKPAGSPKTS